MGSRTVHLGMGVSLVRRSREAPDPVVVEAREEEPTVLSVNLRIGPRREDCGTRERPHRLLLPTDKNLSCMNCGTLVTRALWQHRKNAGTPVDVTPLMDAKTGARSWAVLAGSGA